MKTKPLVCIVQLLLFCGAMAGTVEAQVFVAAEDRPPANRVLDNTPRKNSLPCDIQIPKKARMDFMFRFTAGFSVNCRLGLIRPGVSLFALIRITPQNGQPVLMIEEFDLPALPFQKLGGSYSHIRDRIQISMSGGFAVGPGHYMVELSLIDQHGHTCRKQGKLKAEEDKRKIASTALAPGVVAPLLESRWDGKLVSSGLRVAVFLHAYNPGGARMYAWDRAYLLQSLTALLTHLPCKSVKLVAFNLDRQEEVFRDDSFAPDGFVRLEKALEQMELVTVPYRALMRGAWAKFLMEMKEKEAASKEPVDAIIFLGAWGSHAWDKLPKELIGAAERSDTRLFYLKYCGPFDNPYPPDGLERLTQDLHGSTFIVRSPEALAQAIKKMLAQMNAAPTN